MPLLLVPAQAGFHHLVACPWRAGQFQDELLEGRIDRRSMDVKTGRGHWTLRGPHLGDVLFWWTW
jgi:hypothetical protein